MKVLDGSVDINFDIKKAIGYGTYFITIDIEYKSEKIKLFHIERNSMIFDKYNDFKADNTPYESLQQYLYDNYYNDFEDNILEFCYNIDNN